MTEYWIFLGVLTIMGPTVMITSLDEVSEGEPAAIANFCIGAVLCVLSIVFAVLSVTV